MRALGIQCVVFDVDDTLYLERDYVRSGFGAVGAAVARMWGVDDFAERAWSRFEEGIRGNVFDLVLSSAGLASSPELVCDLVRVYREHQPAIELLPDARVCIDHLWRRVPLAGLTDGPAESQRAKIDALRLWQWLDPVVVTAELGPGHGKPSVEGFVLIEDRTGKRGASCAYVGDNPHKDFAAPRRLGWRTIRVRRPAGLHADVPSGDDVDEEIPDLERLPQLLELA